MKSKPNNVQRCMEVMLYAPHTSYDHLQEDGHKRGRNM